MAVKIYADTADLDEIRRGVALGVVQGATTNPTLLAAHGIGAVADHIRAICDLVEESVSVQVVGDDPDDCFEQGLAIASWHPRTAVKIPITPAGTKLASRLSAIGIRTNMTMVCSAAQGLLALNSGASIVCCYIGRVADMGDNPLAVVEDIANWNLRGGYGAELMAASIRTPDVAADVARAGATILTLPLKVIDAMYGHPVSDAALGKFAADWRARPGGFDAERGRLVLR